MAVAQADFVDQAAHSRVSLRHYIEFVRGWPLRRHQLPWVEALEKLYYGLLRLPNGRLTRKLLILSWPGSGKTAIFMEFLEWVIGKEVQKGRTPQVGYISYADDPAKDRSKAIRNTIEFNPRYHYVFPEVMPAKDDGWGEQDWFIRRTDRSSPFPTFRAAGITGGVLSYRFNFTVIDDPHDYKSLATPHQRDEVWRHYSDEIRTRSVAGIDPMCLISTRWVTDDLAGRLMAVEDDWFIIEQPALLPDGTSAWPPEATGGISAETLLQIAKQDPRTFATQYQCRPPELDAALFKYWPERPWPNPSEVTAVYQSWDTSYTAKSWSDENAGVEAWKLKSGELFIAHVYARKCETIALMEDMKALWQRAKDRTGKTPLVLVENKASGTAIVQALKAHTHLPIRACNLPYGTKASQGRATALDLFSRANAVLFWFESGRVVLPEEPPWVPWKDAYKHQLQAYTTPKSHPDDLVAATVLLLEYVYGRGGGTLPKVVRRRRGWDWPYK